jgi:hypothetical protein
MCVWGGGKCPGYEDYLCAQVGGRRGEGQQRSERFALAGPQPPQPLFCSHQVGCNIVQLQQQRCENSSKDSNAACGHNTRQVTAYNLLLTEGTRLANTTDSNACIALRRNQLTGTRVVMLVPVLEVPTQHMCQTLVALQCSAHPCVEGGRVQVFCLHCLAMQQVDWAQVASLH